LFDLINAKSFQATSPVYQGGLSTFLTKEINEEIITHPINKKAIHNFFKYNEVSENFEKLDRIIRIFEICHLLEQNALPTLIQSTMLKRDAEFWFDMWNRKAKPLFDVIQWIEDENLLEIGQVTFLEYATAIFLANPDVISVARFKHEIKKYALHLTITNSNFSKSNLDIVEKFNDISRKITNEYEFKKYNFTSPATIPNLSANHVLEITTSKSDFQAILNILYNEKPNGKFDRDILGNKIVKTDLTKFDNHHIYPKAKVADFSNRGPFNSIANIVLVDSKNNREDIKDKLPSEYFQHIKSLPNGDSFCKQNLIDSNEALIVSDQDRALIFLTNRAIKIAEAVNYFFNT
jgi:hypothetical protein